MKYVTTKRQLIDALEQIDMPDNTEIFLDERFTEFKYGMLNSVKVTDINFSEDPGGEVLTNHEVIILSEQ